MWENLDIRDLLMDNWKLLSQLAERDDELGDMVTEVSEE